ALYLADFKIYQATSAVAIGVIVLLIALMTLNRFFMSLFGLKMFWPVKKIKGQSDNKLWGLLSRYAFKRPLLAILFVALVISPFIYTYSNELNYNDLVEINDNYESKKAINVIEDHYLAGFSSPITLVMESTDPLNTQENLQVIDQLTGDIEKVDGVAEVYSVTRPEAERIDDLYIKDQASTLNDGVTKAEDGVLEISEGLGEAKKKIDDEQDLSGV